MSGFSHSNLKFVSIVFTILHTIISSQLACDSLDYTINNRRYQQPAGVCQHINGEATMLTCDSASNNMNYNYFTEPNCAGDAYRSASVKSTMKALGVSENDYSITCFTQRTCQYSIERTYITNSCSEDISTAAIWNDDLNVIGGCHGLLDIGMYQYTQCGNNGLAKNVFVNQIMCEGIPTHTNISVNRCNSNGTQTRIICGTAQPTQRPILRPTDYPTVVPTPFPTPLPTPNPTPHPTPNPTVPTPNPTPFPTNYPTIILTYSPTDYPSQDPTVMPTKSPTQIPTINPVSIPTSTPILQPTTAEPTTKRPSDSSDSQSSESDSSDTLDLNSNGIGGSSGTNGYQKNVGRAFEDDNFEEQKKRNDWRKLLAIIVVGVTCLMIFVCLITATVCVIQRKGRKGHIRVNTGSGMSKLEIDNILDEKRKDEILNIISNSN